jgi:hypothetical protein
MVHNGIIVKSMKKGSTECNKMNALLMKMDILQKRKRKSDRWVNVNEIWPILCIIYKILIVKIFSVYIWKGGVLNSDTHLFPWQTHFIFGCLQLTLSFIPINTAY